MAIRRQPIGIELVKKGILTESEVQKALEYQRKNPEKKMGDILYLLKLVEPKILIQNLGEIVGEKGIIITKDDIGIDVQKYISIDLAKKNKVVPFEIDGSRVKVCFADTSDPNIVESTKLLMLNKGLVMEKYITFEDIILDILDSLSTHKIESGKVNYSDDIAGVIDTIIKEAMN